MQAWGGERFWEWGAGEACLLSGCCCGLRLDRLLAGGASLRKGGAELQRQVSRGLNR